MPTWRKDRNVPRVRKIQREPNPEKNHYIVDACFLVNKYIPTKVAPNKKERVRIEKYLVGRKNKRQPNMVNAADGK